MRSCFFLFFFFSSNNKKSIFPFVFFPLFPPFHSMPLSKKTPPEVSSTFEKLHIRIAKLQKILRDADEKAPHLMEYAQLAFDLQHVALHHFNRPADKLGPNATLIDIQLSVSAEEWDRRWGSFP